MAPPKSARNRSVDTKLTEDEYGRMETTAAKCGLTVGEWCRQELLHAAVPAAGDGKAVPPSGTRFRSARRSESPPKKPCWPKSSPCERSQSGDKFLIAAFSVEDPDEKDYLDAKITRGSSDPLSKDSASAATQFMPRRSLTMLPLMTTQ